VVDARRLTIRPQRAGDLGRIVGLWQREGLVPVGRDGLTLDDATDLLASADTEVLVAERDGAVVGVAIGAVTGSLGSLLRIVGDEVASDLLLDELEARFAEREVRRILVTAVPGDPQHARLAERGFEPLDEVTVLRREIPTTTPAPAALSELGGQMIDRRLWSDLAGMEAVKGIIERRIILPLSEPELAARHGVTPPRGVILFGPPGTGKTTFAKGIASRLEWPFVQIESAQLSAEGPDQQPRLLAETFDRLIDLPAAVAFVDEVEDIASARIDERKVGQRVTTEFLRQIPRLRDLPHHLLVCATNWVGRLDTAFLRPGRVDYVLPVGPPDEGARRAIWHRYVQDITGEEVDVDALVSASERFTPADIEFAARKAAQLAFEDEVFDRTVRRAGTEQFLRAIEETRPTLTDEMIETFERDKQEFVRH
jgi:transitional endoplasmic reticulum ATPase